MRMVTFLTCCQLVPPFFSLFFFKSNCWNMACEISEPTLFSPLGWKKAPQSETFCVRAEP